MYTKLVLPILNKSIRTFRGPTWYLTNDLWIKTISPEEYGLLKSSPYLEYHNLVNPRTKCIHLQNVVNIPDLSSIIDEVSKISFLLNYFTISKPVALSFGVFFSKKRKLRIQKIFDLPLIVDSRFLMNYTYNIDSQTERKTISDFYKVVNTSCLENRNIYLTLSRFNAALSKSEMIDKIIDLTISLESLIEGTSELRNRFALYNAWTSQADSNRRESAYQLLLKLYDARSKIVHGSSNDLSDKIIKPVVDNWQNLIEIAKQSLAYFLLFLFNRELKEWYQHQKDLSLGIQTRII